MDYRIVQKDAGDSSVVLIGAINEDAELALQSIAGEIKDKSLAKITFNFAQTTTVNSLGVRAWVQFIRNVEEGRAITFEECTPDVIMQVNMIPNFAGKANVTTFYTNYICESCNAAQKVLIKRSDLQPKTMPEKQKCPACGEPMETEELEEEYFAFLTR